jgi:DNA-binding GntR family transcriptional regulator
MAQTASSPRRPLERQTIAAGIYQRLFADISTGALPPGARLVIDKLAREWDVSITPIREAISRLQSEGLVTEKPFAGLQVSELSVTELRQQFEIRGVLEGYAARLAAEQMSPEALVLVKKELEHLEAATAAGSVARFRRRNRSFHHALLAPSAGHAIHDQIATLASNTERYLALGNSILDEAYLEASQVQHRTMVDLLDRRRADELEVLVRGHALMFVEHMTRRLAQP